MWVNRKEYEKLIDEKQSLKQSADHRWLLDRELAKRNAILASENIKLRAEIDQLKVRYADEVEKNFKLASYLSENKNN
jgi:hypothetical protein